MATETLDPVPETLQADVVALQNDMAMIKGQLPHLATKADLAELRADVERLPAHFEVQLSHLATKADMERGFRQLTWALVGTLLVGLTALAGLIVALQIFT